MLELSPRVLSGEDRAEAENIARKLEQTAVYIRNCIDGTGSMDRIARLGEDAVRLGYDALILGQPELGSDERILRERISCLSGVIETLQAQLSDRKRTGSNGRVLEGEEYAAWRSRLTHRLNTLVAQRRRLKLKLDERREENG